MIDRQRTAPGAVPRSYRAAFGCISDAAKATAEVEHFIPVNVGPLSTGFDACPPLDGSFRLLPSAMNADHVWTLRPSFCPLPSSP